MTLSQPGSAEKTIRKIDIAQVRKEVKPCLLGCNYGLNACRWMRIPPRSLVSIN
jgi:hypothetical protein